jgi:hypothetical protein
MNFVSKSERHNELCLSGKWYLDLLLQKKTKKEFHGKVKLWIDNQIYKPISHMGFKNDSPDNLRVLWSCLSRGEVPVEGGKAYRYAQIQKGVYNRDINGLTSELLKYYNDNGDIDGKYKIFVFDISMGVNEDMKWFPARLFFSGSVQKIQYEISSNLLDEIISGEIQL